MTARGWLILSAVVAVGALAVSIESRDGIDDDRWIEVTEAPFVRRIHAAGELRSADTVVVGCPPVQGMWNFTITWLETEGKEVAEGQRILSFDGQRLRERLQLVRSRLDTARSELVRTKIQQETRHEDLLLEQAESLARFSRINQKLSVPDRFQARIELAKFELDREFTEEELRLIALRIETQETNRESMVRSAENRVAEYERKVRQLETSLAALTVTAQRAGFVVHVENWGGKKPKVGETIWSGASILEIADLSSMEVFAHVAERDARYVEAGQRVEVRLDASPDRVFEGEIVQLGKLFRTKSADVPTIVFDVVILVDDPDPELMRPGMSAGVEIMAPDKRAVIQVPEAAVEIVDGAPVLRIERDGARRTIPVTLGLRWEGNVIVTEGLVAGDHVKVRS